MEKETADNLLKLVKSNYEKIAVDFDVSRKKPLWPEIVKLGAALGSGSKILDVGCGNGRLLAALPGKDIEYLGADNSLEMLTLARKNYPSHRFVQADLLDLSPISGHDFTHIFCLAVWQHIPSESLRIQALRELKNKLAVGGEVIISVWNMWSKTIRRKNYRFLILKTWLKSHWLRKEERLDFGDVIFSWKNSSGEELSERYYHAFTKRELRRLALAAGFKISELNKDKFNYWLILK